MNTHQTDNDRIPQLRVVLNTTCGKRCIYCRPSGEASHQVACGARIETAEMLALIGVLLRLGVRELRLTGGEPALHPSSDLIFLVREIKQAGAERLSLVTRNGSIGDSLDALREAGLDWITFSLDSMAPLRWCRICQLPESRQGEHAALLDAIRTAARVGLRITINSVLLADTSSEDIESLLAFAASVGANVKFEELIRDIGSPDRGNGSPLHIEPEVFARGIREQSERSWTTRPPGGLGHPMVNHRLQSGITVTWKAFSNGACYGDTCKSCEHYPCDDALMALRLLPDGTLQTCLKRDDDCLDLIGALRAGPEKAEQVARQALNVFARAKLLSSADIECLRTARHRRVDKSPLSFLEAQK